MDQRAMLQPNVSLTLRSFDSLPDSAQVDVKTVAGLFGCAVPTVWRRSANGLLPTPRKFGSSARWSVGELRKYLPTGSEVVA
jgi:predicted DNA-binding transcriptional regulator AlpA